MGLIVLRGPEPSTTNILEALFVPLGANARSFYNKDIFFLVYMDFLGVEQEEAILRVISFTYCR
jgi:hypothetical protein